MRLFAFFSDEDRIFTCTCRVSPLLSSASRKELSAAIRKENSLENISPIKDIQVNICPSFVLPDLLG